MNGEAFEQAREDVLDGTMNLKTKEEKEAFVIQYITAYEPRNNRIWTSRQLAMLFSEVED